MKKTLFTLFSLAAIAAITIVYSCSKEQPTTDNLTTIMQTPPPSDPSARKGKAIAAKTVSDLEIKMWNNYYYLYGKDTALSCSFISDSAFALNFTNGVYTVVVKGTNIYGTGACCGYAGKYYASLAVFNNIGSSYAYYDYKMNAVPFTRYSKWSVNIVGDATILNLTFEPNYFPIY
jgi:hypothetical protein